MNYHNPPFSLRELKIEVTHCCELNCIHCSSLAEHSLERQMSWDECSAIINEAAAMGAKEIAFSGGEPLMWSPLGKAIELATTHNIGATIYTTGISSNSKFHFEDLKKAGLSRTIFSVYDSDPKGHDQITKYDNSLHYTIDEIKKCKALGLDVELHFVPMSLNYKSLQRVAVLATNLAISRLSILRLVPQGRSMGDNSLPLSNKENLELRKIIGELKNNGYDIRLGSPYNFLLLNSNPRCSAGIDRLSITPDLSLYPCDAFKQITPQMLDIEDKYSNLHHCSLQDAWEKSAYLNLVKWCRQ